jgi:hypothetical protein
MWKAVWREVSELLWLASMVGGLSLLSMAIAVAAMALGASQYPTTAGF